MVLLPALLEMLGRRTWAFRGASTAACRAAIDRKLIRKPQRLREPIPAFEERR